MKRANSALLAMVAGYCVYSAVYLCRYNLTVVGAYLEQSGLLTAAQYSLLGSLFSFTYAFGRLINGWLVRRGRGAFFIAGGIGLAGFANICMGLFPSGGAMTVFWAVNGYAQSMIWGPLLDAVTAQQPEKKKRYAASVLVSSVSVGSVLGILTASFAAKWLSVQSAFFLPGASGLLCALGAWRIFGKETPASGAFAPSKSAHLAPSLLLFCVLAVSFLHGCIRDNVSYWAALFFMRCYKIDIQSVAGFVFLMPLLGFVGRAAYPVLFARCHENEHTVSVWGFLCCAVSALGLCLCRGPLAAAVFLCIVASSVSAINTSLLSVFPLRFQEGGQVPLLTGILDFSAYLGAGISLAVYGRILENSADFSTMFLSWIAVSVAALGLLGYCQKKRKK